MRSNTEIKLLLSKAKDTHKASLVLLENHLLESAVGRAYYTMFYVAQGFLLSKNLSFSSYKLNHKCYYNHNE
ncbi:HEPN domain-containing protein [Geminocystis herdmanii]|uniref:HEPN domain-containing protein n=1 Tax=Geminocystis herdmanii TaxID=669359 RepID=UPI000A070DB2